MPGVILVNWVLGVGAAVIGGVMVGLSFTSAPLVWGQSNDAYFVGGFRLLVWSAAFCSLASLLGWVHAIAVKLEAVQWPRRTVVSDLRAVMRRLGGASRSYAAGQPKAGRFVVEGRDYKGRSGSWEINASSVAGARARARGMGITVEDVRPAGG